MADLQGPKIRIGSFKDKEGITLQKSAFFFFFCNAAKGDQKRVHLPHPELFSILRKGSILFLNDGKVKLLVIEQNKDSMKTQILIGGKLRSAKGINIPGLKLPYEALTQKDQSNLALILEAEFDFIALSFVQSADDIEQLKTLSKNTIPIIAKIEKAEAIENFEAILSLADGIMIARGDLGIELPFYKLPPIQKELLKKTRKASKMAIVATQMLESMRWSSTPTRAEVSDVANAVYDGASAILLSAETAIGAHPIEAVEAASAILIEAEKHVFSR